MSDSLLGAVLSTSDFVDSLALIAEYKQDNPGSKWLGSNFPHIMSQLDSLTLGWTLVPKTIVRNAAILTDMVAAYKTNMQYGVSAVIPSESDMLHHSYEVLLSFLEGEVLPIMQRMPDDRKELETDAFAEAFAEGDIESDDGGPDEEAGEDGDEAQDHSS